jgi:hypothetical protein
MSGQADGDDIVRAVSTTNYVQAHIWEQALRAEGIECKVVGDYLMTGAVGGLPGVPAEIWVRRDDLERALEVLKRTGAEPEQSPEEAEGGGRA